MVKVTIVQGRGTEYRLEATRALHPRWKTQIQPEGLTSVVMPWQSVLIPTKQHKAKFRYQTVISKPSLCIKIF